MNNTEAYKNELERELLAAHGRLYPKPPAQPRRRTPRLLLAAAAVILIAAVVTVTPLFRPAPVAAETLEVTRTQDNVRIRVTDIVTDPDALVIQLKEEADLTAEFYPVPVDPRLVGQIKTVSTTGTGDLNVVFNSDRVVTEVTAAAGMTGTLIVEYGIAAQPGEYYQLAIPDARCVNFYGRTSGEIGNELTETFPNSQYELVNEQDISLTDLTAGDIPSTALLADITPSSTSSHLVLFVSDLNQEPAHENCAP